MEVELNNIETLIRNERLRRGMTQGTLGLKKGVSKAHIPNIEYGRGWTVKTVEKDMSALDLSAKSRIDDYHTIDKRVIGYIVVVISEFAKACDMTIREASNYLRRYKGLDFLIQHYEAEHLLSLDDCVQDLVRVCSINGGNPIVTYFEFDKCVFDGCR